MKACKGLSVGNKCVLCGPVLQWLDEKRPPPVNIKEAKQPSHPTEDSWLYSVCLCYPLSVVFPPKAQTSALGSRSCQSLKATRCMLLWPLLCAFCSRVKGIEKNRTTEWAAMLWIAGGWAETIRGSAVTLSTYSLHKELNEYWINCTGSF